MRTLVIFPLGFSLIGQLIESLLVLDGDRPPELLINREGEQVDTCHVAPAPLATTYEESANLRQMQPEMYPTRTENNREKQSTQYLTRFGN